MMSNTLENPTKMPKRVSVEEADNGYMVSMMGDKPGDDKKMVCKDLEEAGSIMKKMMQGEKVAEEPKKETDDDIKNKAVDFFKKNKEA